MASSNRRPVFRAILCAGLLAGMLAGLLPVQTARAQGLPLIRDWFVIHLRDKRLSPIASAFRSFLLEYGAAIIEKTIEDSKPLLLAT